MKKLSINNLENITAGAWYDGFCTIGAGGATIGKAAYHAIKLGASAAAKSLFGGPVGVALGAADVACAAYGIYSLFD